MKRSIYLDFNSTSPLSAAVAEAMTACYREGYLNPASPHREGRRAKSRLEAAREQILRLLGGNVTSAASDRLIFTSGGTESNNLALRGFAGKQPGRIIISAVEHPSIAETADHLATLGFEIVRLPVNDQGIVKLESFESLLSDQTRLVSVMLGNNETGVIQPVAEIAARCAARNIPMHTDAVQAVGKIPVDFGQLGVAAMTFTAHKLQGPRGIGGLLVRHPGKIEPIVFGGSQQLASRPGTESVALAVGCEVAIVQSQEDLIARSQRITKLRDQLEAYLLANCPACTVNGGRATRLPHTLNVSFSGCDRQALLMALDQRGVACSTGSACASGSQEPSPVLLAMGCSAAVVSSSLRISLGGSTTEEEVLAAGQILLEIVGKMRPK